MALIYILTQSQRTHDYCLYQIASRIHTQAASILHSLEGLKGLHLMVGVNRMEQKMIVCLGMFAIHARGNHSG